MKRNHVTRSIFSVLLSVLLLPGMMPGVLALAEGETISAAALSAELGAPLHSVTATGKETTTALGVSGSTDFYTYQEGQDSAQPTAGYATDTDLNATVVELKSTQLASYSGTTQSFWNGTNHGTTSNFQGSTVDLNKSYLGVAAANSGRSNATYAVNSDVEQEYAFSVMFKSPKAADVSLWLFGSWNNMQGLSYTMLRGGMKFDQGVEITNGLVYMSATGYSGESGVALNQTALEGDTWYKAVRIMKFPQNAAAMEKVLILGKNSVTGEYDTVVAASDLSAWQTAAMSSSNANRFGDMMFIADYPASYSGTTAKITDYATYTVGSYNKTVASDAPKSRALEVDLTGTATRDYGNSVTYDMVFVADRMNGKTGKSQSLYVTFMLPDVGADSLLKFFRYNISSSGKYAGVPGGGGTTLTTNAPFPDSYALTVKGGTLYANVYSNQSTLDTNTAPKRSLTNLAELSAEVYYTQQQVYTGLTAGKWYTVELIRNDITSSTGVNTVKLYDGKVSRNESLAVTGTALASWGNGTDQLFTLPYVSTATNAEVDKNTAITFLSGANYTDAVYVDALDLRSWADASCTGTVYSSNSYGVVDNWLTGYTSKSINWGASLSVGDLWHSFRLYGSEVTKDADGNYTVTGNSGNDIQDDTPFDAYTKIGEVAGDDYLKTGEIDHLDAENITITYDVPIHYTEGMVVLKTIGGQAVATTAAYDAAANTITVDITEALKRGESYTLTVGAATTTVLGYTVAGGSYSFTCLDLLAVSGLTVLDSTDAAVTESLGAGTYTAKVTLQNDCAEDRSYLLLLAIYKGNAMVDVMPLAGTVAGGTTVTPETPALTVTESGCTAKAMVWSSWTDIAPLIAALPIP